MKEIKFVKKTTDFSKNLHIDLVKKMLVFDEVDSTNIIAKELAQAGAEEGTVVIVTNVKYFIRLVRTRTFF